jgi:hypothetical protein
MKKLKKLQIKKVTLRDLDEPTMQAMAGGQHKPPGKPSPLDDATYRVVKTCGTCCRPDCCH